MRLLANENVAGPLIQMLRRNGHDVASVKERWRGIPDKLVLAHAQSELRIVLTCDKEFGELAFRAGLPASCGVILLRLSGASPDEDNARALSGIESRTDWAGHFAVITAVRLPAVMNGITLPRDPDLQAQGPEAPVRDR